MSEKRREIIHSMLRRLNGWDYRGRAIYQITVTLADRSSQALARLEVRRKNSPGDSLENERAHNRQAQNAPGLAGGKDVVDDRHVSPHCCGENGWLSLGEARKLKLRPEEIAARTVASEYGEAVFEALREMSKRYPQVSILAVKLMPDHLHFIAFVRESLNRPFGALVRGFKAGAVSRWKAIGSLENLRENAQAQNGRFVSPRFRGEIPGWSEGFQDTVLLHEGQLKNMQHYLADNPRRRAIKALFPELFKVVGEIEIQLSVSPDSADEKSAENCQSAKTSVGHFAALGNRFLLERQLLQVQVSRRDFGYKREPKPGGGRKICRDDKGEPIVEFSLPLYEEKKSMLFAGAKHGAVLISPCISDGEKQIAHEALAAGMPLITMQNKGFSPMQKPSGRYFDACADGRLLMIAPAAWPYVPGEKQMSRFDATAMNRLCQWIVGENAAEINYHGMQPVNIDSLAIKAANVEGIDKSAQA